MGGVARHAQFNANRRQTLWNGRLEFAHTHENSLHLRENAQQIIRQRSGCRLHQLVAALDKQPARLCDNFRVIQRILQLIIASGFFNINIKLDIDDVRAGALGLSIADINSVLATAWGSSYVNDFIENGRVKKVFLQSAAPFRMVPEDIGRWYVKNNVGEMVPFSAFSTAHWNYGSPRLERYNGIPSIQINGQAAPGVSTGEAMAEMEKMIAQLPEGYDTEVGALGTALSAGQRQRIGLARALYQDPFVVLLDEPNASLDAVGERALNDTIKAIRARGGIAVIVAHRPSVLAAVDMVAAVHAGRLAAFGTKEEVLGNRDGKVVAPTTVAGSDQINLGPAERELNAAAQAT